MLISITQIQRVLAPHIWGGLTYHDHRIKPEGHTWYVNDPRAHQGPLDRALPLWRISGEMLRPIQKSRRSAAPPGVTLGVARLAWRIVP